MLLILVRKEEDPDFGVGLRNGVTQVDPAGLPHVDLRHHHGRTAGPYGNQCIVQGLCRADDTDLAVLGENLL